MIGAVPEAAGGASAGPSARDRMSRAFVNEDAPEPERRIDLPPRDDPGFDEAAAWALIDGARMGDSHSAAIATGYRWGEPRLRPYVERILAHAVATDDERLRAIAERFLRHASSDP